MASKVVVIPKVEEPVADKQMGITIGLEGTRDLKEHLQALVDDGTYKKEDMDNLIDYTDGYKMTWDFDTPSVVAEKAGAIDAACLSSEYGQGMVCVGIIYAGTGQLTASKFALWLNTEQKNAYDVDKPLEGNDDSENWWTAETSFTTTFSMYRWMPKEVLEVAWYKNFYRFSPEIVDTKIHKYQSADTKTYTFDTAGTLVALLTASTLSATSAALGSFIALYSLF